MGKHFFNTSFIENRFPCLFSFSSSSFGSEAIHLILRQRKSRLCAEILKHSLMFETTKCLLLCESGAMCHLVFTFGHDSVVQMIWWCHQLLDVNQLKLYKRWDLEKLSFGNTKGTSINLSIFHRMTGMIVDP